MVHKVHPKVIVVGVIDGGQGGGAAEIQWLQGIVHLDIAFSCLLAQVQKYDRRSNRRMDDHPRIYCKELRQTDGNGMLSHF